VIRDRLGQAVGSSPLVTQVPLNGEEIVLNGRGQGGKAGVGGEGG